MRRAFLLGMGGGGGVCIPEGVDPSEEGRPAGCADWESVGVTQQPALPRQRVQLRHGAPAQS
jgi:hypothetical protein